MDKSTQSADKSKHKTLVDMELEKLMAEATPTCRHCHGKGHTGYNLNKDAYILCRCVKRNRRAKAAEDDHGGGDGLKTFNGFNELQVANIRRKREEAELLEEKAKDAESEFEGHHLQPKLKEASEAVESEHRVITAKVNTAEEHRTFISKESDGVRRCDELIAGYKREKAQRLARIVEMEKAVNRLEAEVAKVEAKSRSEGPQRVLSQIEKRFHQQTHKASKKGREAARKAERIRQHLDATYPGHEQVP